MSGTTTFGAMPILQAAPYLIGVDASSLAGRVSAGGFAPVATIEAGHDLNDLMPPSGKVCLYVLRQGQRHAPEGGNPNGALLIAGSHTSNYGVQLLIPLFAASGIFFRGIAGGKWQAWQKLSGVEVATVE
ncbi:MAG: pyocin knob domain-containing protein [Muribaculaceae bacterium]|nr:pyocin knob domain-containing protein [Muribaculaceae bacterium]